MSKTKNKYAKTASFYALRRVAKGEGQVHVEDEKQIKNKINFLIEKIKNDDVDLEHYRKTILDILVGVRADLSLPLLVLLEQKKGKDYLKSLFTLNNGTSRILKDRMEHVDKVNEIVALLEPKRLRKMSNTAIMISAEKALLAGKL
jgi:hypothetical protein